IESGAPDRTRTCYRRLRRPVLYPDELRAPVGSEILADFRLGGIVRLLRAVEVVVSDADITRDAHRHAFALEPLDALHRAAIGLRPSGARARVFAPRFDHVPLDEAPLVLDIAI